MYLWMRSHQAAGGSQSPGVGEKDGLQSRVCESETASLISGTVYAG